MVVPSDVMLVEHVRSVHSTAGYVHLPLATIRQLGLEGCDICFGVRRAKDKHDQSCIALDGANATISTNALLAQVLATKSIANYDLGSISLIDNMSWADIFCANSRFLKRIPAAPAVVHAFRYICNMTLYQALERKSSPQHATRAWKLFFLLPWLLLQVPAQHIKGRTIASIVSQRLNMFLSLDFLSLFQSATTITTLFTESVSGFLQAAPAIGSEPARKRHARVVAELANGNLSKACTLLSSDCSFADLSDNGVRIKLNSLFLTSQETSPVTHHPIDGPTSLVPSDVERAIKSSRPSAGGSTGWAIPFIKSITASKTSLSLITTMFNRLLMQDCPVELLTHINTGMLTALSKPDGNIRPIVSSDALLRLLSKTICLLEQRKIARQLEPIQAGVGMPGGVEFILHTTRHLLNNNRTWVLISIDCKNAFGSISRSAIMQQLIKLPKSIAHHTLAYYRAFGLPDINIRSRDPTLSFTTNEGVLQGDPLSPLLFSLGLKEILTITNDAINSEGMLLAYLDDVFILGPLDVALRALDVFKHQAQHVNLSTNPSKTTLLTLSESPTELAHIQSMCDQVGLPPPVNCVTMLGCPMGLPRLESQAALALVLKGPYRALKQITDKQSKFLLLHQSIVLMTNNMSRTLPPSVSSAALKEHDAAVLDVLLSIIELAPDEMTLNLQAEIALPIAHGGLGLRPLYDTAHHAYFASVCSTIQQWRLYIADTHPLLVSWCPKSPPHSHPAAVPSHRFNLTRELQSSIDNVLITTQRAKTLFSSGPGPSESSRTVGSTRYILNSMPLTVADLLLFTTVKRLQGQIKRCFEEIKVVDFKRTCLHNDSEHAQFLSKSQAGASAFLRAIPSTRAMLFSNPDYQIVLRLYLRLPLLGLLGLPSQVECHCGRTLATSRRAILSETHLLTCTGSKVMTNRHNAITNVFADMIRSAKLIPILEEVASELPNTRLRYDISINRCDSWDQNHKCDVTIVNPLSTHLVKLAAKHPRSAADKKAASKRAKYKSALSQSDKFIPLVFETFGAVHPDVFHFVHTLSLRVNNVPPTSATWAAPTFTSFWLQRLSVCLWRENARSVSSVIQMTKNKFRCETSRSYDTQQLSFPRQDETPLDESNIHKPRSSSTTSSSSSSSSPCPPPSVPPICEKRTSASHHLCDVND